MFDCKLDDTDLSCGAEFFDDLLSNESLYASYLNGYITFDDLMRAVHRKGPSDTNRESIRKLGDTVSLESDDSDTESARSVDTNDSEFIPRELCGSFCKLLLHHNKAVKMRQHMWFTATSSNVLWLQVWEWTWATHSCLPF